MQNHIKPLFLAFFLFGCYATTDKTGRERAKEDSLSFYPNTPEKVNKAEFRHLYRSVANYYETGLGRTGFNGAFLVAKKGEIIYEKYNGNWNIRNGEKIDSLTSFHLASVSKTFTGMAVMKLWEEGKLGLNDEVSAHLAGFPFAGVTVKTLLDHRSGLPNYVYFMEQLGWDKKRTVSNADVLQFMIDHKAQLNVGRPDKHFTYCNTNYALLALIVEKVSGMDFPQYLQQTFFTPLHMDHTFIFSMEKADQVLPSFNYRNQKEAFTYLDAVYGDKNVYSTVRDMLKWDQALTFGNLFKPTTLDSAYTGYSNEKPGIKNYGLGWRMYNYPNDKKIIYHNGWWHGNNTFFNRLIQDSATIIVLGNRFNKSIYQTKKLFPVFSTYEGHADDDE
jgi:CubicO group peptidase (beta-lactamase class C family)